MKEKNCLTCHYNDKYIPGEYPCFYGSPNCRESSHHFLWTASTNGDKVRRMSDEELADLLFSYAYNGRSIKKDAILQWLKEEE